MHTLHDPRQISFGSDNLAGIAPEVLEAIRQASGGHVEAYGDDAYTRRFSLLCEQIFGAGTRAFPVVNGTGANVLALAAATPRWGGVVVPSGAHTVLREAGAPEHAGLKLISADVESGLPAVEGKLTPEHVRAVAAGLGDQHAAQPATLSIANPTEVGTVYTPHELAAITAAAHESGMTVHVDGARLANAAAYLDISLGALTSDVGVDVVSLGGTKNGAMLAEAVVVLPGAPAGLGRAVEMSRKAAMQLASKQRFVSAQLLALFEGDLWLRNARHANEMAGRLAEGLGQAGKGSGAERGDGGEAGVRGEDAERGDGGDGGEAGEHALYTLAFPRQSNAVFACMPKEVAAALADRFHLHGEGTLESPLRVMCAFDTPEDAVDGFLGAVEAIARL